MLRYVVVAALGALSFAPAMAQDAGGTQAAKPPVDKKICRRSVATGSVMAKTLCRTKAEWDAINGRSQSDLERRDQEDRNRANVGASRGF